MNRITCNSPVATLYFVALLALPVGAAERENEAALLPDASSILERAAAYLAGQSRFSVLIRDGYNVVQESGQKIEFGDLRNVLVQRPNNLRIEIERSDGDRSIMVFDGKELTAFHQTHNVYAKAPLEGDVDAAIIHFVGDLRMRLPLAMLLLTSLPSELERRVQSLEYVEESTILGRPCDHLAGRTQDVDFQVWVAHGDKPLIHRVVLTYKNETGAPQFRAQFSDWNFAPRVAKRKFAFTPPTGASQIQFLAHMIETARANTAAPAKTGDQP